jgi:hypothetical protein
MSADEDWMRRPSQELFRAIDRFEDVVDSLARLLRLLEAIEANRRVQLPRLARGRFLGRSPHGAPEELRSERASSWHHFAEACWAPHDRRQAYGAARAGTSPRHAVYATLVQRRAARTSLRSVQVSRSRA